MGKSNLDMTYDRDFGPDYQQHVLAVLLRMPDAVLRYRTALDHTFFSDDVRRTVARVLLQYVDEYGSVPTRSTVVERLRKSLDEKTFQRARRLMVSLYSADISDHQSVLESIVAFGKTQAMINAVLKGVDLINAGKPGEVEDVVQEAGTVGEDLLDVGLNYSDQFDIRVREKYVERKGEIDVVRIPTGIVHVDQVLEGGMSEGEMGCVAGHTGVGKSHVLVNIGYGALTSGYCVVHYVTSDMSKNDVEYRYDSRMAEKGILHRQNNPEKFARLLRKRRQEMNFGRLVIQDYPARTLTVEKIRSHLRLLRSQGFVPAVVIVDYADVMLPSRTFRGEPWREMTWVYEKLHSLAGQEDVVLWTASQVPGSPNDLDVIGTTDLADSKGKSRPLNVLMSINQTDREYEAGTARLYMAKVRRAEGRQLIECEVAWSQCLIQSTSMRIYGGRSSAASGKSRSKRADVSRRVGEMMRNRKS